MMVKIRKDLNEMVSSIQLKKLKTRYNERNVCLVTLFDKQEVEFKDADGLYDLFQSYKKCGKFEGLILSKTLVEEEKTASVADDIVDEATGTYFCVLYKLSTGREFRLFLNRPYIDKLIIENSYEVYKTKKKEEQPQSKPQVK